MLNFIDDRYIGSTCEIRSFSNELLSIGIIGDVSDEYIGIAPHDDRLRYFDTGAKLKINIFNSKVGFTVLLGEVLTSSMENLKIVDPIRIVDHERRSGFRVAVELWAKLSITSEFSDAKSSYDVYVNDLSISGLRIISEKKYALHDIFWMQLEFEKTKILTQIQIVRTSEKATVQKNGKEYYEHGIKLINLRPDDDDKLCSYIFKRQREISSKIK